MNYALVKPDRRRPPIHVILCADAFAGKSTVARSFPYPINVACFDAIGAERPYLECGRPTEWYQDDLTGMPSRLVYHPTEDLVLVKVESYVDPDPTNPVAWDCFRKRMRGWPQEQANWGTWVCDSITKAEEMARFESMFKINTQSKSGDAAHGKKHYGHSAEQITGNLLGRIAAMPINVVVTAHYDDDYDEVNGITLRNPSVPGKLTKRMPAGFDVLARLAVDWTTGKRWLQVAPDAQYNAGTRIGTPNGCAPTYEGLWSGHPAPTNGSTPA